MVGTDNALQIHGGNGYALEYPISRVLCDARILNIFEGAANIKRRSSRGGFCRGRIHEFRAKGPLARLRIVEVSAFVAAPLGGMILAQLRAEVIRIDPIARQHRRWTVAARTQRGEHLYRASLNKAKRSVTPPLDTPGGPGHRGAADHRPWRGCRYRPDQPARRGWMKLTENLRARRDYLIMIRLRGNHDGSGAVDYTVNCASGFPLGNGLTSEPYNHVLPAWDVAAGLYLAVGLLRLSGCAVKPAWDKDITLALSDVMLATVGTLGYIGDVQINGVSREPIGNHLYGAFGRDFATKDGRHVMLVAISTGNGVRSESDGADDEAGHDRAADGRGHVHRGRALTQHVTRLLPNPSLGSQSERWTRFARLWTAPAFNGAVPEFGQLVAEDPRCSAENPMFEMVGSPASA